ncbi:hypothetical protein Bca4012_073690 [Brassica carinata]
MSGLVGAQDLTDEDTRSGGCCLCDVVRVSVHMVRIRIERVYIMKFGHSCETPPSMKDFLDYDGHIFQVVTLTLLLQLQVDVSRRLRHEFYVFERHEISRKEASDGSRHDFMKRLPLRSSLRKVAIYETDDFVAEGLKTVKNRAQVVKALLLLHTESDDSSQYPRLTSQLSLLSTLSQAVFLQHNRDVSRHDMRHVVEGWPIAGIYKKKSLPTLYVDANREENKKLLRGIISVKMRMCIAKFKE